MSGRGESTKLEGSNNKQTGVKTEAFLVTNFAEKGIKRTSPKKDDSANNFFS